MPLGSTASPPCLTIKTKITSKALPKTAGLFSFAHQQSKQYEKRQNLTPFIPLPGRYDGCFFTKIAAAIRPHARLF
jgi:hypothetical protein